MSDTVFAVQAVIEQVRIIERAFVLGRVDKFEAVAGDGEVDHAKEAADQLVIARGAGLVDLEVTEHTLDAVALLV